MKRGPRTLKQAVGTLKMRNILADVDSFTSQSFAEELPVIIFLFFFYPQTELCIFFPTCLQTSDVLKMERPKKTKKNEAPNAVVMKMSRAALGSAHLFFERKTTSCG